MQAIQRFFLAALTGAVLASCSSKKEKIPPPVLELDPSPSMIVFGTSPQTFGVVTDQGAWDVRSSEAWCEVTPDFENNAFTVTAVSPKALDPAVVTVTAGKAAPLEIPAVALQGFDPNIQIPYPNKTGTYALIVAPSAGWENYRYQADAYLIYQMLKANGLDDDHIMLFSEDDIARHANNPQPGYIPSPSGDRNLCEQVTVDFKPSSFDLQALIDAIEAGSIWQPGQNDNLFVYWAGAGEPGGLKWMDQTIPAAEVADFFKRLSNNYFRKLFLVLETDYAGQVGKACEDLRIPGLLCFAASGEEMRAQGGIADASGQIRFSDFTNGLYSQLVSNGDKASLYEMYAGTYARLTRFSGAAIYNADHFGNLYFSNINEFIYP